MFFRHYGILLLAVSVMGMTGCGRGADDRTQKRPDINFQDRSANHGPGYTTVGTRTIDRARLSNNVVMLTHGQEMVYVQDAAYYEVPIEPTKARQGETKALQASLDRIEKQIDAMEQADARSSAKPSSVENQGEAAP